MAVSSEGTLLVNAIQLGSGTALTDVISYAEGTGLPVFVGVVVPKRMRPRFVRETDDALADVVGRLGPGLTPSAARGSASSRSSGARGRGGRGRRAGPAVRPQGRRP